MANILIVDSYFPIGLLYCEVLQEQGHRVFVAMSGEEALRLGLYENIEIAVVDDELPDLEAEELLGKLKQLQPHMLGLLSISSTFGSPGNIRMWDGTFIKTNDFRVLQAEIERLWREPSIAVSAPPLKDGEYEIAPEYV